jgi:hypothetical protein
MAQIPVSNVISRKNMEIDGTNRAIDGTRVEHTEVHRRIPPKPPLTSRPMHKIPHESEVKLLSKAFEIGSSCGGLSGVRISQELTPVNVKRP